MADNFWKVPNPCFIHTKDKGTFVNSEWKVKNALGMVITLCDDCCRRMKGHDSDNQSGNTYQKIQPGEVVQTQLSPSLKDVPLV